MEYLFIAFYGWPNPPMKQDEATYKIEEDFECWNLKKFSAEEFIETVKTRIPPENENVLKYYLTGGKSQFGISKDQYEHCLWGLLIPKLPGWLADYRESLSLLNLFSTKFMQPAFCVSRMGISKISEFNPRNVQPNDYQGYEHFKTSDFTSFYKTFIDQTKYFVWMREEAIKWSEEDWRLFMAANFYEWLEKYERGKTIFTWQRESADMTTFLETLFTAGDSQNEEITYRLRKRIGALIQWKFSDIEKDIQELYKDRSDFIHGNHYKKIIKEMRKNPNDKGMPLHPDFEKLYRTKEQIRFIFVAYLYLHKIMNSESGEFFNSYKNVQQILEEAILNTKLRVKITEAIKPIIELLPES